MKIETKFNYGQKVWCVDDNKVNNCTIMSINVQYPVINKNMDVVVYYSLSGIHGAKHENQIFATKEELINSL